jgi:hypothetical protein
MSWTYNPFTGKLDKKNKSLWEKLSSTVDAASTGVVDAVENGSFESLKYIVTVFNQANTAYRSFEFNVLNNNGAYKETVSHRLNGGNLSVRIDSVNNSGSCELQITNNESYEVNVELAKLVLP